MINQVQIDSWDKTVFPIGVLHFLVNLFIKIAGEIVWSIRARFDEKLFLEAMILERPTSPLMESRGFRN